jgi:hypothetical protein
MFTMSSTVLSFCNGDTGLLTPSKIGPTAAAPPRHSSTWYAALPAARPSNTSVLALRVKVEKG